MREKPANEAALARLIDYLNDLWLISEGKSKKIPSSELQEYHKVAKRTFSDCKALKIIKLNEDKTFTWLDKNEPSRVMALKVLDYRLKKTKKTVHYPIPEFAAIGETLKDISERLVQLAVMQEKWLKTPQISINKEGDLFRVEDQRLYIAGQIASSAFNNPTSLDYFKGINDRIIIATDDLMQKLLKKD